MSSWKTLEAHRRRTASQQLEITLEILRSDLERMFTGTPEMVDRRLELGCAG